VILAVDDEPAVLAAVARDLRRGFGERFRVMRATSAQEALLVPDAKRVLSPSSQACAGRRSPRSTT
jgi:hypothetical protein